MASRISRREWVRGLPSASGVGKYDRKQAHSASERSVGYGFLIRESVRNYPNPQPYQTGSQRFMRDAFTEVRQEVPQHYSVGSCLIRSKEGKLTLLEGASKAGEALTPASGRRHV